MENCKYLISRGANLAQMDKSCEVILKTVYEMAPMAMSAVQDRFDEGLSMTEARNSINLDFLKIYGSVENVNTTREHDMLLFKTLAKLPETFREYVEHPLSEAFLSYKFRHVKYFFWIFSFLPTLIFSVVFSIYSILLFGKLCKPDEDDNEDERYEWTHVINCKKWGDVKDDFIGNNTASVAHLTDLDSEYRVCQTCWIILVVLTTLFCLRELCSFRLLRLEFFTKIESYRHVAIDVLLISSLYKGFPHFHLQLERWQYHVATCTSFLLWLQTMIIAGKYPGYGKYVHMFK